MVKATSLASIITMMEVTGIAHKLISQTFRAVEIFICAGAIYLILNFLVTRAIHGARMVAVAASARARPRPAAAPSSRRTYDGAARRRVRARGRDPRPAQALRPARGAEGRLAQRRATAR